MVLPTRDSTSHFRYATSQHAAAYCFINFRKLSSHSSLARPWCPSPSQVPNAPTAYPFMAALYISKSGQNFLCGGTLISGWSVVTAGHCLDRATSVVVLLGPLRLLAFTLMSLERRGSSLSIAADSSRLTRH